MLSAGANSRNRRTVGRSAYTVLVSIAGKLTFTVPHEASLASDPKIVITIYVQNAPVIVYHCGGVDMIEHCESRSIKTRETCFGCDPQIAVLGLPNGLDPVVRETILFA